MVKVHISIMFQPVYRVNCRRKGPLKRDFLDIYQTTFFGVRMFKTTSAMRVIFFRKIFKLDLNLENGKKNSENIFRF